MDNKLSGYLTHSDRLRVDVCRKPNQVVRNKFYCGYKSGNEVSFRNALECVGITGNDQDLIVAEGIWK